MSDLVTDPLTGEFADYINTVGGAAGTEVAAQMMGMPRGRSRGASAGGVLTTESTSIMDTAAAGSGTGVTVLESEHEDVMDEIDRIEESAGNMLEP